jgi:potassium-transporting ATPase KdpC subunit
MFWTALKLFLAMTVLTGCIYPFLITVIATRTMPHQANGSLIFDKGKLRGSELIVQPFAEERYFWPRPSALDYNTLRSYGSNLGPTSQILKEKVRQRAEKLAQSNPSSSSIPVDLLYTSGSGLDPHISVEGAIFQIDRIARARSLSPQDQSRLHEIIEHFIEGRTGVLGPQYVNVLLLNMQLDEQLEKP